MSIIKGKRKTPSELRTAITECQDAQKEALDLLLNLNRVHQNITLCGLLF